MRHSSSFINHKRRRSPVILSTKFNRQMAKSKRRLSFNVIPNLSPSIFYYSLTNIDNDDHHPYKQSTTRKKFPTNSSKFDIGYASEDALEKPVICLMRKCRSDTSIPSCHHRLSTTTTSSSAYETSSNPDIDQSFNQTKQLSIEPSLSIYRKKYTQSPVISQSYDASVEYTDGDQSENDVDSPNHHHRESLVYNRYATTTTGYSSDIEPTSSSQSEPCWDGYQVESFFCSI